jgi:hypothetical protein
MKTWEIALAIALALAITVYAVSAAYIPSRQPAVLQLTTTVPVNITMIRVDCLNRSAGYAPPGTPIMLFSETVLYADSRGGVRIRLWPSVYYLTLRREFTYGRGWIKLVLHNWTWSDIQYGRPIGGNGTDTFLDFSTSSFTRITIRYKDYRKLRVTYGSGGYILLDNQQVANGTELWIPLNCNVTLTATATANWYRGARGAQPSFWIQNATVTFTMDDGYWIHAEFQG